MKKDNRYKDFKVVRQIVETEMIQNILEYLRNGVFPNNKPNSYMNAYTAVHGFSDEGDKQCHQLLEYHNGTIKSYIQDCSTELSKESSNNLIDSFITHTDHISFLIYWLNRIFCYLDRFYTKAKCKKTLAKSALDLYTSEFFDNFKNTIFTEVNKLIKEDRAGNREYRAKIKNIMTIIKIFGINLILKMIQKNLQATKETLIFTVCLLQNIFYHN